MLNLPLQKKMYIIPAGCLAFILFFTVFGDKGLLRIVELKQDKDQNRRAPDRQPETTTKN